MVCSRQFGCNVTSSFALALWLARDDQLRYATLVTSPSAGYVSLHEKGSHHRSHRGRRKRSLAETSILLFAFDCPFCGIVRCQVTRCTPQMYWLLRVLCSFTVFIDKISWKGVGTQPTNCRCSPTVRPKTGWVNQRRTRKIFNIKFITAYEQYCDQPVRFQLGAAWSLAGKVTRSPQSCVNLFTNLKLTHTASIIIFQTFRKAPKLQGKFCRHYALHSLCFQVASWRRSGSEIQAVFDLCCIMKYGLLYFGSEHWTVTKLPSVSNQGSSNSRTC